MYTPTEAPQPKCDSFYSPLQATISEQKTVFSSPLMGDFIAKVGCEWENAGGAIGKFGIGDVNEAGERLIQFANVNKLVITNMCFRQAKAKWTCESPDGFTHNMLDHTLINNKWRRCVNNSRAIPSADIGSDHQLLIANIRLKLKVQKKSATLLRYDTKKLDEPPPSREYEIEVSKRLLPVIEAIETNQDDVNVMYAKVVGSF